MFGITTGTVLDVAIGLAVMYLMFSLVGTTVNEMAATVMKLRSKQLGSAMQAIVDHPPLRSDFYNSGIIAGFADAVKNHPSYIASDNFAHALLNSLDPSKSLPNFSDVRQAVQLMPDCNIRDVLLAQIVAANGDLDKLRTGVATWYDSAMDRVSGLYKRDMKYLSVAVGILIAIAFNADSVSVTRALWQDPDLRAGMVKVARERLDEPIKQQAQISPSAQPPTAEELKKELDEKMGNVQKAISEANAVLTPLPIGWSQDALVFDPTKWTTWTTWLWRVVGWLITGLAVSLGAPFWFDFLSKFINIRGTGDKPARASDSDS
jgi:hypothetical protein